MAITPVQAVAGGTSDGNPQLSWPATPTAGNLLVMREGGRNNAIDTDLVVADGWAVAVYNAPTGTTHTLIAYKIAGPSEPSTVTFHTTGSIRAGLELSEWESSEGWPSDPLDVVAAGVNDPTSPNSTGTTGTTTVAESLALAAWGVRGDPENVVDRAYTNLFAEDFWELSGTGSTHGAGGGASRILSATQTVETEISWTGGDVSAMVGAVAVFAADSSGEPDTASGSGVVSGVGVLSAEGVGGDPARITMVGDPMADSAENGGNVTLAPTESLQEGDVLLLAGGTGAATLDAVVGPQESGYTELVLVRNISTNGEITQGIWVKRMGETPDSSVTGLGTGSSTDGTTYVAYALRGVDAAVLDVDIVQIGPFTTSDPDLDPITTESPFAWVLAVLAARHSGSVSAYPSGYSDGVSANVTETRHQGTSIARKEVETPGVEDPGPFTKNMNDRTWYGFTVAIRPTAPEFDPANLEATVDGTTVSLIWDA